MPDIFTKNLTPDELELFKNLVDTLVGITTLESDEQSMINKVYDIIETLKRDGGIIIQNKSLQDIVGEGWI